VEISVKVTFTLAHYGMDSITAVRSFIVQASGLSKVRDETVILSINQRYINIDLDGKQNIGI